MASRSHRLAPTFVLGDLAFLSSKVYIFTHMTSVLVHFALLIKLDWHCTSLNIIVNATFFGCNCGMLSKASIDQNELQLIPSLILQWTLGFIALVPIYNVWHIFWYDIPEWMLLKQTHAYEQMYVFLLSDFMALFPKQSLCWLLIRTPLNKCSVE